MTDNTEWGPWVEHKGLPSQERLRTLFDYNEITGELIWKHRPITDFKSDHQFKRWNTRYSGSIAGHMNARGYWVVSIDNVDYHAHRLVYAYHFSDPDCMQIDHINQTRRDNRIENLRLATNAENQRNAKLPSNNSSGVVGVHWQAADRKWCAQISVNGHRMHLGIFSNKSDAISARAAASLKYGFSENHGTNRALTRYREAIK